MPFRTLSTRVAVPAGLFALVTVALLSVVHIRGLREQALAEVVHGSESIGEAVLLSIDRDMRVNRRDGVREMVETVRGERHIWSTADAVLEGTPPENFITFVETVKHAVG